MPTPCSLCSRDNPEGAKVCAFCGSAFGATPPVLEVTGPITGEVPANVAFSELESFGAEPKTFTEEITPTERRGKKARTLQSWLFFARALPPMMLRFGVVLLALFFIPQLDGGFRALRSATGFDYALLYFEMLGGLTLTLAGVLSLPIGLRAIFGTAAGFIGFVSGVCGVHLRMQGEHGWLTPGSVAAFVVIILSSVLLATSGLQLAGIIMQIPAERRRANAQ